MAPCSDTRPVVSVFAGRIAFSRIMRATDVHVRRSLREDVRIDGVATISRSTIEDDGWEGIVLTGRGPVTIEDTAVRNNS
jgi:hypothetical protein